MPRAELLEFEVADNLRSEETRDTCGRAHLKSRCNLVRHPRTAHAVGALGDGDPQTGFGEVVCGNEAVVACPDDDRIERCDSNASRSGNRKRKRYLKVSRGKYVRKGFPLLGNSRFAARRRRI